LTTTTFYSVYNILGKRVLEGTVSDNQKIYVQNFKSGIYFLKLENGKTIKLIKE
jgi:hypothetical protein